MLSQVPNIATHNQLAILIIYRTLLGDLSKCPTLLSFPAAAEVLFVTNLIVKEAVLDIFRDSRCSLNIIFTYLVARSIDTIVEHVSIVPY